MFARASVLSLALPLFAGHASGQIQLDVNSQDSIKSAAQSIAGGIVKVYNSSLAEDGGVPGLFPDPYYFWEAGTVWNALVEYSHLTGDSQYDALVSQALQFQTGEFDAYMPLNQTKTLGNDDQSCWGLAAMTAAEVGFSKPSDAEWVDYAVNVWDTQSQRLDFEFDEKNGTCGGGLRWQIFPFNNGFEYKNTWSNGNFFLLSARLAKFTGNATYSQYADKVFKWSRDVKLVDDNFRVFDGTDAAEKCADVSRLQWSATHGLYTEGAALMYNMTGAQNWTQAVKGFVNASSVFQDKDSSVLVEVACENRGNCDVDQRAFKGVFARTMARTSLAAPIVSDTINKMLSTSAKAAANACTSGTQTQCSHSWVDPESEEETYGLGELFNALEIVQGLLYPSAKGLKTANGAGSASGNGAGSASGNGAGSASGNGNGTQDAGASGTSGANAPQNTGAAGSVTASITLAFAGAFMAMLTV